MEEANPPIYVKTVVSGASPLSNASVDTFQTSLSPALDSDIIQPSAFVPTASVTAQASETYIDEKASASARGPAFRTRNAAPEPESSLLITAKSPLRIHKESAIVEDYRVAIADKPTLETAVGAKSINKPDVHLDNTKGDIRTKLYLSDRQGEVFVRLYAAQGSIELSIDMDYKSSSSNIVIACTSKKNTSLRLPDRFNGQIRLLTAEGLTALSPLLRSKAIVVPNPPAFDTKYMTIEIGGGGKDVCNLISSSKGRKTRIALLNEELPEGRGCLIC